MIEQVIGCFHMCTCICAHAHMCVNVYLADCWALLFMYVHVCALAHARECAFDRRKGVLACVRVCVCTRTNVLLCVWQIAGHFCV